MQFHGLMLKKITFAQIKQGGHSNGCCKGRCSNDGAMLIAVPSCESVFLGSP